MEIKKPKKLRVSNLSSPESRDALIRHMEAYGAWMARTPRSAKANLRKMGIIVTPSGRIEPIKQQ